MLRVHVTSDQEEASEDRNDHLQTTNEAPFVYQSSHSMPVAGDTMPISYYAEGEGLFIN